MYLFLFAKNAKVSILGKSSTYPHKDNCYRIEVNEGGSRYQDGYASKAQIDLGLKLQTMLTFPQMRELQPLLEALYDEGYETASTEAAEEAAGASM